MLYAHDNRKSTALQYPAESNKEISKRLGSNWKMLEAQEKTKYFERAKAVDLEHKKKYPNYVYNPKEARIRKAMREATRDRSIGASPMLPRPSARRPPPNWVGGGGPGHPDDPLIMQSPLGPGMRGSGAGMDFPISTGSGSSQFMPPMSGGYSKLDAPLPPNGNPAVHHNYNMQPNPLAQLQQQTEMWNNYQDSIRPRSSGNPFMMDPYPAQAQPPDVGGAGIHHHQQQHHHSHNPPQHHHHPQHQRQTHSVSTNNMPMTPPHSNENVPPDEFGEKSCSNGTLDGNNETCFESKQAMEVVQPLMENNNMQPNDAPYNISMFGQNMQQQQNQHQFGGVWKQETNKIKKQSHSRNQSKKVVSKPLPDFNEAFGTTERGRFQSPPDPRLAPNKGYLDYNFDTSLVKFEDYQL